MLVECTVHTGGTRCITTRLLASPVQSFLSKAVDFSLAFPFSSISTYRTSQSQPYRVCQTWLQRARSELRASEVGDQARLWLLKLSVGSGTGSGSCYVRPPGLRLREFFFFYTLMAEMGFHQYAKSDDSSSLADPLANPEALHYLLRCIRRVKVWKLRLMEAWGPLCHRAGTQTRPGPSVSSWLSEHSLSISTLSLLHRCETLALNQHLCFSSCLFLLNIPSDVTCLLRRQRNSMLLLGLTYFGTPITQHEVTNEAIWHEKSSDLQRATFMVVLADYNVESYLIITL
ncbi:hypothetical protein MJT46_011351 [Ovis ammon polii x Ovis aries]|nr:hypothetical protein MJT46_011351 [Ovis ammon polii x Ovis aries]